MEELVGSKARIEKVMHRGGLDDDERVVLSALVRAGFARNGLALGWDGILSSSELAEVIYPLMYQDDPGEPERSRRIEITCKRRLRKVINSLVIRRGISISCQAGSGGGYFLPATVVEVEHNHALFHKRAMTGLVKATRGRKSAYADAVIQLTMDFDRKGKEIADSLGLPRGEDSGPPPWVSVVTGLLQQVKGDPNRYAAEIKRLQDEFGDIFVRRDKVRDIRKVAGELNKLLEGLAE